jgi:exodeoxyribonuclease V alpha subunit
MTTRREGDPMRDPLEAGCFEEIDRQFARFLLEVTGRDEAGLALAAALASSETRRGHVCFDLASGPDDAADPEAGGPAGRPSLPPLAEWVAMLRGWDAVGLAGEAPDPFRPLVLDGANRLYLHRYWKYERELVGSLLRLGQASTPPDAGCGALLDRLFPPSPGGGPDGQREAAVRAISRRVTFITGGPGTGKTTTVVKILALLAMQAGGVRLDMALAAPTGKAAARLKEAVESARSRLAIDPRALDLIPSGASTLHWLLGAVPGAAKFRRGPGNPLPHDVVIVDEASMIDLPMMARLVAALAPGARLVLLGDRDQLSSVEPGKVFGDLCDTSGGNRLKACVALLEKSWRFGEDSGIGALARLVNAGAGEEALSIASSGRYGDIAWRPLPAGARPETREIEEALVAGYRDYLRADGIREQFEAFRSFRVLCAYREGPYGVEAVNALAGRALARAGLIDPGTAFHAGRPIMVTRNDYRIRLYNGDIGLVRSDPDSGGALRVFFPSEDGGFRAVAPGRLPEHVSAYAMTIHKSQGSEFDRVLLLLGTAPGGAMTRELLYTGITRARSRVDIRGGRDAFLAAAARRTERKSGLKDALAGDSEPDVLS